MSKLSSLLLRSVFNSFLIAFAVTAALNVSAENVIAYSGISLNTTSIQLDKAGALTSNENAVASRIFAATKLNQHLYLEYAIQDLGKYDAKYDFTVGNFRFVESHDIDFSKTLSVGLITRISFNEFITHLDPELKDDSVHDQFYFNLGIGALLWRAELEMKGLLYDTGTPYKPYGATGDGMSVSEYYQIGLDYKLDKSYMLSITFNKYVDIGRGTNLCLLNGGKSRYAGRTVETLGVNISYMF